MMNAEVVDILERLLTRTARHYSAFDFGREKDPSSHSVVVPEDQALLLLPEIRKQLSSEFVAFIGTTRWLGDEKHKGVEVAIGRGGTQFDILRLARSDACNYDMDTEDIIKKLQRWNDSFGVDIFHAETDTIEFILMNLPVDVPAFAYDVYEFCPDIVDQGVGSVEALEKDIKDSMKLFLWWD